MADDTPDTGTPDTGTPDTAAAGHEAPETPVGEAAKRPPAASAAARARRIGGRVTPRPGPDAADLAAGALVVDADEAPAKPVRLAKFRRPGRAAEAAETDQAAESDPDGSRVVAVVPGWLRWLPAEVLTAGAVAMAVLMIVFSHGVWWGRPSGNAVREEMLAAAKTCVAKTNTYKYTELDKYAATVKQCTTGRLTSQINQTISTVIKKYAPTLKATQTAQISRGGIEAVSPQGKQWTVLLFGQLSVVNTNDPKGRTDPFGAQVQMEKVNGKWLMSGLKTIASPVS
ncbi:MAG: hypothetical protein QOE71_4232 [Pseudonocardiales bacterium]|nr:hypothetical protein [Pseudonocardiales bacterium]